MNLHHVSVPLVPRLETLEGRDCPSANAGFFLHSLFVFGDSANNHVVIMDDGQGNISATSDGTTVTGSDIRNIIVMTGSGNDSVSYTLTGSLQGSRRLFIDLGQDDDTATFDGSQGASNGLLAAAVLGGSGADTIQFHLGTIMDKARALITLAGGTDSDQIAATFAGALHGGLALAVLGGAGNDSLAADLHVDTGSTGKLAAIVHGGSGDDTMTLNVNDGTAVNGQSALDAFHALLDGGSGTNTSTYTNNVTAKHPGTVIA